MIRLKSLLQTEILKDKCKKKLYTRTSLSIKRDYTVHPLNELFLSVTPHYVTENLQIYPLPNLFLMKVSSAIKNEINNEYRN